MIKHKHLILKDSTITLLQSFEEGHTWAAPNNPTFQNGFGCMVIASLCHRISKEEDSAHIYYTNQGNVKVFYPSNKT